MWSVMVMVIGVGLGVLHIATALPYCPTTAPSANCVAYCLSANGISCDGGGCTQYCELSIYTCPMTCAGGGCTQKCDGYKCSGSCQGGGCLQYCSEGSCSFTCEGGGCVQQCSGGSCLFDCRGGACSQYCSGGSCTMTMLALSNTASPTSLTPTPTSASTFASQSCSGGYCTFNASGTGSVSQYCGGGGCLITQPPTTTGSLTCLTGNCLLVAAKPTPSPVSCSYGTCYIANAANTTTCGSNSCSYSFGAPKPIPDLSCAPTTAAAVTTCPSPTSSTCQLYCNSRNSSLSIDCPQGGCYEYCDGGGCIMHCSGGKCSQYCQGGTCDFDCTGGGCSQWCEGGSCQFSGYSSNATHGVTTQDCYAGWCNFNTTKTSDLSCDGGASACSALAIDGAFKSYTCTLGVVNELTLSPTMTPTHSPSVTPPTRSPTTRAGVVVPITTIIIASVVPGVVLIAVIALVVIFRGKIVCCTRTQPTNNYVSSNAATQIPTATQAFTTQGAGNIGATDVKLSSPLVAEEIVIVADPEQQGGSITQATNSSPPPTAGFDTVNPTNAMMRPTNTLQNPLFISHAKEDCSAEVKVANDFIASKFPTCSIFCDTEQSHSLADLVDMVSKSGNVFVFLTPNYIRHAHCLCELHHALKRGIRITLVMIRRRGKPTFDVGAMNKALKSHVALQTYIGEGVWGVLQQNGINVGDVHENLKTIMRTKPFALDLDEPQRVQHFQLEIICDNFLLTT